MEVVRWANEAESDTMEVSVGGLGGFFNFKAHGMRWNDYLAQMDEADHPRLEAIRRKVLADNIREPGDWHQREGYPVFDDGTIGSFSFRAWGDLLAAIWSEQDNLDYNYMNFYYLEGTSKEDKLKEKK